jgi:hypothetical protein
VNAIAGNQGHLQTVSPKKPPEICAKKRDHQNTNKLQGQNPIKQAILEK